MENGLVPRFNKARSEIFVLFIFGGDYFDNNLAQSIEMMLFNNLGFNSSKVFFVYPEDKSWHRNSIDVDNKVIPCHVDLICLDQKFEPHLESFKNGKLGTYLKIFNWKTSVNGVYFFDSSKDDIGHTREDLLNFLFFNHYELQDEPQEDLVFA